ncbi:diguanylate cyclase [Gluconacetobacter diazotrophicus]|uniref:diguanylate cyclase n=1 Tax=Gluconacetobacter diazotrophicus TaxID=33996 RepID=UPI00059CADD8|nr:diguanylate cyclase [Gluconacetobacter diazotrophicus]
MRWRPCRRAEPNRSIRHAIVLVLIFGAITVVTRFLCSDDEGYTSFWPPNAVMLAALLTLRMRLAACVLVACFLLNLLVNRQSALSPPESLLACVLNVFLVVLAAPFTRRFCGAMTNLTRPRRFVAFTIIAVLAAAVEAGAGTTFERVVLDDPSEQLGEWLQWVFCDALGLLLATPAMLSVLRYWEGRKPHRNGPAGPVILSVVSVVLAIFLFSFSRSSFFLFTYPVLVLLAFRASAGQVLTSIFFVSVFTSALTAHGLGPIARLSPDGHLMRAAMLQPYLFSLFLTAVLVSNASGENRRHTNRLSLMKQHLEYAATHDSLTSLINRRRLRHILVSLLVEGSPGAVFLIDIDHFKQINDSLGHHIGDEVLKAFSKRMVDLLACRNAHIARLGGDEFAAIVPGHFTHEMLDVLCSSFADGLLLQPYILSCGERSVTASIGAAFFHATDAHLQPGEIIRRADVALYQAKRAGRNGYCLFSAASGPPSHGQADPADHHATTGP